jgi:glycosyltransferase involved in cell wall biosynthesis
MITICPELRSSVVERIDQSEEKPLQVIHWTRKSDLDPELARSPRIVEAGFWGTVQRCIQSDATVLELPEPLWVRYWPRSLAIAVTTRFARNLLGRPRQTVVTYAIENLPALERLTVPHLDRWPAANRWFARAVAAVVRHSALRVLDAIAYGTAASRDNYADLLKDRDSLAEAVFPERLMRCMDCASGPGRKLGEDPVVLFLGELSERKGVPTLLHAWSESSLPERGWKLLLLGDGPLRDHVSVAIENIPSAEVRQPTRTELHHLLNRSRAVVLLSHQVPRWTEQVGLSLLEGEAHECSLIVTSVSGAAEELAQRSNAQIVRSDNMDEVVAAINRLEAAPRSNPGDRDSRAQVRVWFESVAAARLPA